MSRASEAQLRLAVRKRDSSAEPVTYSRQSVGFSGTVLAEFGRRHPSRAAVAQIEIQFDREPMDFLINSDDWLALAIGEPQRGDRLTTADGLVYEVGPRDGEPAQRFSDQFGHRLRLKTMREV